MVAARPVSGEIRRISSQDTLPIPRQELIDALRAEYGPKAGEPYEPMPDDETPTAPDLGPLIAQNPCTECKGKGLSVEQRPYGTYHGPVTCTRCSGTGLDPDPPARTDP